MTTQCRYLRHKTKKRKQCTSKKHSMRVKKRMSAGTRRSISKWRSAGFTDGKIPQAMQESSLRWTSEAIDRQWIGAAHTAKCNARRAMSTTAKPKADTPELNATRAKLTIIVA